MRSMFASRSSRVLGLGVFVSLLACAVWFASLPELDRALDRLAERHHFLAVVIARDLHGRMPLLEQNARLRAVDPGTARAHASSQLLVHLQEVQREGNLTILLHATDGPGFRSADGRIMTSPTLERALSEGEASMVLDADAAAALGFPARRAVAGFATLASPDGPPLRVVVLSSGQREADGYRQARRNTALAVGSVGLLIFGFAISLWREQRRSLVLGAKLERSTLAQQRDAELARADRFAMLATMSSGIAHELGTPLTIVYGRLEQLETLASREPSASRAVASMTEQVERMRGIIRGFLALARGESPTLVPASAQTLADDAHALTAHRFEAAHVGLSLDVAAMAITVTCDPPLLVQALVTLLVNACQASNPGDVVVLRVRQCDDDVQFCILDEGHGIEADIADRARAPFFTTRARVGGTGLGLAIANEIAQQHGGSLVITSRTESAPGLRAGRGTMALLTMPAAPAEAT